MDKVQPDPDPRGGPHVNHAAERYAARVLNRSSRAISRTFSFELLISTGLAISIVVMRAYLIAIYPARTADRSMHLRFAIASGDIMTGVGGLLALVVAIVIAQQTAGSPKASDPETRGQSVAWSEATAVIALVAGPLAVLLAVINWFSVDLQRDWTSIMVTTILGGMALAVSSTLQRWSAETVTEAYRIGMLEQRITYLGQVSARFPGDRRARSRVILGLMSLFVLACGFVGAVFASSGEPNWVSIFALVLLGVDLLPVREASYHALARDDESLAATASVNAVVLLTGVGLIRLFGMRTSGFRGGLWQAGSFPRSPH